MAPSADSPQLLPIQDLSTAGALSSKSPTTTHVHEITSTPSPKELPPPHQQTLVLHPSFITTDFDALRFEAAAYNQLPSPDSTSTPSPDPTTNTPSPYSTSLISSPYNQPGHYLSLPSLPTPSGLLALALTALRPTTPSYATTPYATALNFPTIIHTLRSLAARENYTYPKTTFYVVVFRSRLRPNIDQDLLYRLDAESHREACESGGLLKYWFGKADGERRNLATCFWHTREDAVQGGAGPWHKKARQAGRELYESIVFEVLGFTVEEGAGGWRLEEWVD